MQEPPLVVPDMTEQGGKATTSLTKVEAAKAVSAAELIIDAMLYAETEGGGAVAAAVVPVAAAAEGEGKTADRDEGAVAQTYGERFRAAPVPKQKAPKKPRLKWGAPTSRILRKILNPGAKDFVDKNAEQPVEEQTRRLSLTERFRAGASAVMAARQVNKEEADEKEAEPVYNIDTGKKEPQAADDDKYITVTIQLPDWPKPVVIKKLKPKPPPGGKVVFDSVLLLKAAQAELDAAKAKQAELEAQRDEEIALLKAEEQRQLAKALEALPAVAEARSALRDSEIAVETTAAALESFEQVMDPAAASAELEAATSALESLAENASQAERAASLKAKEAAEMAHEKAGAHATAQDANTKALEAKSTAEKALRDALELAEAQRKEEQEKAGHEFDAEGKPIIKEPVSQKLLLIKVELKAAMEVVEDVEAKMPPLERLIEAEKSVKKARTHLAFLKSHPVTPEEEAAAFEKARMEAEAKEKAKVRVDADGNPISKEDAAFFDQVDEQAEADPTPPPKPYKVQLKEASRNVRESERVLKKLQKIRKTLSKIADTKADLRRMTNEVVLALKFQQNEREKEAAQATAIQALNRGKRSREAVNIIQLKRDKYTADIARFEAEKEALGEHATGPNTEQAQGELVMAQTAKETAEKALVDLKVEIDEGVAAIEKAGQAIEEAETALSEAGSGSEALAAAVEEATAAVAAATEAVEGATATKNEADQTLLEVNKTLEDATIAADEAKQTADEAAAAVEEANAALEAASDETKAAAQATSDAALAKKEEADAALRDAENAKDLAETAREEAGDRKGECDAALAAEDEKRQAAEAKKSEADNAVSEADAATSEAEAAKTQAETLKTELELKQADSESKLPEAEGAVPAAEESLAEAAAEVERAQVRDQIQGEIDTAKTKLQALEDQVRLDEMAKEQGEKLATAVADAREALATATEALEGLAPDAEAEARVAAQEAHTAAKASLEVAEAKVTEFEGIAEANVGNEDEDPVVEDTITYAEKKSAGWTTAQEIKMAERLDHEAERLAMVKYCLTEKSKVENLLLKYERELAILENDEAIKSMMADEEAPSEESLNEAVKEKTEGTLIPVLAAGEPSDSASSPSADLGTVTVASTAEGLDTVSKHVDEWEELGVVAFCDAIADELVGDGIEGITSWRQPNDCVMIERLSPESPLVKLGVRTGFQIVSINSTAVASVRDVQKVLNPEDAEDEKPEDADKETPEDEGNEVEELEPVAGFHVVFQGLVVDLDDAHNLCVDSTATGEEYVESDALLTPAEVTMTFPNGLDMGISGWKQSSEGPLAIIPKLKVKDSAASELAQGHSYVAVEVNQTEVTTCQEVHDLIDQEYLDALALKKQREQEVEIAKAEEARGPVDEQAEADACLMAYETAQMAVEGGEPALEATRDQALEEKEKAQIKLDDGHPEFAESAKAATEAVAAAERELEEKRPLLDVTAQETAAALEAAQRAVDTMEQEANEEEGKPAGVVKQRRIAEKAALESFTAAQVKFFEGPTEQKEALEVAQKSVENAKEALAQAEEAAGLAKVALDDATKVAEEAANDAAMAEGTAGAQEAANAKEAAAGRVAERQAEVDASLDKVKTAEEAVAAAEEALVPLQTAVDNATSELEADMKQKEEAHAQARLATEGKLTELSEALDAAKAAAQDAAHAVEAGAAAMEQAIDDAKATEAEAKRVYDEHMAELQALLDKAHAEHAEHHKAHEDAVQALVDARAAAQAADAAAKEALAARIAYLETCVENAVKADEEARAALDATIEKWSVEVTIRFRGKVPIVVKAAMLEREAAQLVADPSNNVGWRTLPPEAQAAMAQAEALWRQAAEAGSVEAMVQLANMYSTGRGVPVDVDQADGWFAKAHESDVFNPKGRAGYMVAQEHPVRCQEYFERGNASFDSVQALVNGGMCTWDAMGKEPYELLTSAKNYWLLAASFKPPHAEAMKMLGMLYQGYGVEADDEESLKWYLRSAENGCGEAQLIVARKFTRGEGAAAKDPSKAAAWFGRAAEPPFSSPEAQYEYGRRLLKGIGVPEDREAAIEWICTCASHVGDQGGYPRAAQERLEKELSADELYGLGARYMKLVENELGGLGKPKGAVSVSSAALAGLSLQMQRHFQCARWLWIASAQKDNMEAQIKLAYMARDGRGVQKDDWAAVVWFTRAAFQGSAEAQYNLGVKHLYAQGVVHGNVRRADRISDAVDWLSLAACNPVPSPLGHVGAQFKLAGIYERGEEGIPKDTKRAISYYQKAARQERGQFQPSAKELAAKLTEELESPFVQVDPFDEAHDKYVELERLEEAGAFRLEDPPPSIQKGLEEIHAAWVESATHFDNIDAQFNLATLHTDGRGCAKSATEAIRWYVEAARRGDAVAQFNLGCMYSKGADAADGAAEGHDRDHLDHSKSIKWFSIAGYMHNHKKAQFNLGYIYEVGQGLKKPNLKFAKKWYAKALANGLLKAGERLDEVEKKLKAEAAAAASHAAVAGGEGGDDAAYLPIIEEGVWKYRIQCKRSLKLQLEPSPRGKFSGGTLHAGELVVVTRRAMVPEELVKGGPRVQNIKRAAAAAAAAAEALETAKQANEKGPTEVKPKEPPPAKLKLAKLINEETGKPRFDLEAFSKKAMREAQKEMDLEAERLFAELKQAMAADAHARADLAMEKAKAVQHYIYVPHPSNREGGWCITLNRNNGDIVAEEAALQDPEVGLLGGAEEHFDSSEGTFAPPEEIVDLDEVVSTLQRMRAEQVLQGDQLGFVWTEEQVLLRKKAKLAAWQKELDVWHSEAMHTQEAYTAAANAAVEARKEENGAHQIEPIVVPTLHPVPPVPPFEDVDKFGNDIEKVERGAWAYKSVNTKQGLRLRKEPHPDSDMCDMCAIALRVPVEEVEADGGARLSELEFVDTQGGGEAMVLAGVGKRMAAYKGAGLGLRAGDMLHSIDGRPVYETETFRLAVGECAAREMDAETLLMAPHFDLLFKRGERVEPGATIKVKERKIVPGGRVDGGTQVFLRVEPTARPEPNDAILAGIVPEAAYQTVQQGGWTQLYHTRTGEPLFELVASGEATEENGEGILGSTTVSEGGGVAKKGLAVDEPLATDQLFTAEMDLFCSSERRARIAESEQASNKIEAVLADRRAEVAALRLEVEGLKKETLSCHARMESVTVEKVSADVAQEGGLFAALSFSLW